ncbi:MAG TPA: hypothetical protein PK253_10585 [Spirochaetota bacterium]|nr:hypothetical protein [Spirochaetota bacterium]
MVKTKTVAIVTGHGGHLGTGHIQRAVSIAWYLNSMPGVKSFILAPEPSGLFNEEILQLFVSPEIFSPDIIIRDMRDSTVEEIHDLQRISKVLALDDIGEGRNVADWCVDLLPNPVLGSGNDFDFQQRHFIFGYNFISSISEQQDINTGRTIDVMLYCGNDPDREYLEKLLGLLPGNITCAVAAGEKSYIVKGGKRQVLRNSSYGDLLFSSKVVVTHFGLLVYEALLSGAGVITINPSEYHSELAQYIAEKSDVKNLGTRDSFSEKLFRETLDTMLNADTIARVNPEEMYRQVIQNLERFSNFVLNLIE